MQEDHTPSFSRYGVDAEQHQDTAVGSAYEKWLAGGEQPDQSDGDSFNAERKDERKEISHLIRYKVSEMLDYLNWACSFPNQERVTDALKAILELVPGPEDEHKEIRQNKE